MYRLLAVSIAFLVSQGCAFMSYTVKSSQRIVSQSAYPRTSPLMGAGGGDGAIRVGGSAELAPRGSETAPDDPEDGARYTPVGEAEGWIAMQLGRRFELGVSLGAFFGERRGTVDTAPLPLKKARLMTGGLDARVLFDGLMQTSMTMGLRAHELRRSWDFEETCSGDCNGHPARKTGGGLDEVEWAPGTYFGVGFSPRLGDRVALLFGLALEVLPYFDTHAEGEMNCDEGSCDDGRPPKPPEVHYGPAMTTYFGLSVRIAGPLHGRVVVQPKVTSPKTKGEKKVEQYALTRAGLELVF